MFKCPRQETLRLRPIIGLWLDLLGLEWRTPDSCYNATQISFCKAWKHLMFMLRKAISSHWWRSLCKVVFITVTFSFRSERLEYVFIVLKTTQGYLKPAVPMRKQRYRYMLVSSKFLYNHAWLILLFILNSTTKSSIWCCWDNLFCPWMK